MQISSCFREIRRPASTGSLFLHFPLVTVDGVEKQLPPLIRAGALSGAHLDPRPRLAGPLSTVDRAALTRTSATFRLSLHSGKKKKNRLKEPGAK